MAAAQATAHLDRLTQLYFPDNGLLIDSPSISVAYSNISQLHFADEKIYAAPPSSIQYFSKEVLFITKLRENLELGQKFLALLYSYRSVSRGIPMAQTHDQANKPEMYKVAYEVIKPEIRKMKDLFRYSEEATTVIASAFKVMAYEYKDGFASNEFLSVLAESLDLIVVIDALKNSKASLNNDFSIYKRIWSNLKNLVGEVEDETMENHALYAFLGTQNIFAFKLREKLSAPVASGQKGDTFAYEELLVDVLNYAAYLFENKIYFKPEEKHMLLKAMIFGLSLLDSDPHPSDERDITKRKRIKLERFGQIIKMNPIVPFFGDMQMQLNTFFLKCPKLSQQRWEFDGQDQSLRKKYCVVHHVDSLRSSYKSFVCNFKYIANMNQIMRERVGLNPNEQEECEKVYRCVLEGIILMSDITSRILEQSAWKLSNPTNNQLDPSCPPDASDYEMAVRYNYSIEERFATTECIGFVKSIFGLIASAKHWIQESISKNIYCSLQTFIRNSLKDIVAHVLKKKKTSLVATLHHIFNIMSDNFDIDILEDVSSSYNSTLKQKKDSTSIISPRIVSVASTQLHYIKVLLDSLVNEKSKGMQGGFLKDKDLKEYQITDINSFLESCFYFNGMLNLDELLLNCSDLSELWYKEFYLELTKQIQFPIDQSLPWILTETVLENESPEISGFILYPLDIYNDAANKALHKLKSRYLYDEIEAEVNLCFDQFIWKFSQKVFADFKTRAASYMLDKTFKRDLENRLMVSDTRFDLVHRKYEAILKQKRFQLLGRTICISKMVAQFCGQHLRQSIDTAIARFEANDLTFVIELDSLLKCSRLTHKLLSQHMQLDPIDDIIEECNESLSLVNSNGRILSHALQETISDFVPNFCYNCVTERFIRTPLSVSEENSNRSQMPKVVPMHLYGTKNLYQAHYEVFKLYRNFIGYAHFEALCRILGHKSMSLITAELCKSIEMIIKFNITPYIKALTKGMPPSSKLPPFEYGPKGCLDYFQLILKPILTYRDLKSGVFQIFRELGNSILFILKIETVFKCIGTFQLVQTSSFFGKLSNLVDSSVDPKLMIKNVLEESNTALRLANSYTTGKQQGELIEQLYKPTEPLNLLDPVLDSLLRNLQFYHREWGVTISQKDDLLVEKSNEFYRFFSAILFAFSIPTHASRDFSNRELFGEGFLWAGATMVHLLEENKRFAAFDFVRFLCSLDFRNLTNTNDAGSLDIVEFYQTALFNNDIVQDVMNFLDNRRKTKRKSAISELALEFSARLK